MLNIFEKRNVTANMKLNKKVYYFTIFKLLPFTLGTCIIEEFRNFRQVHVQGDAEVTFIFMDARMVKVANFFFFFFFLGLSSSMNSCIM